MVNTPAKIIRSQDFREKRFGPTVSEVIYKSETNDIGKSPFSIGNASSNSGFSMVMSVFGGAHLKNPKINSTQSALNFGFAKRVPNKDWLRLVENSISSPHKKLKISRDFLKSSLTMISLSNHY